MAAVPQVVRLCCVPVAGGLPLLQTTTVCYPSRVWFPRSWWLLLHSLPVVSTASRDRAVIASGFTSFRFIHS
ncbi:MAG: hypothetical protein HC903_31595 [Methylacidiphilales bacterium]|nr:hypothetical protein [Candidatus Methylacidiphilales bacterium]NJR15293.1 hypothetical protein [Calothrix sp. CSU_2_0]